MPNSGRPGKSRGGHTSGAMLFVDNLGNGKRPERGRLEHVVGELTCGPDTTLDVLVLRMPR